MARVIKAFTDGGDGKPYRVGDDYAGGDERIADLAERGFVAKPRKPKKKKEEAAPDADQAAGQAEEE